MKTFTLANYQQKVEKREVKDNPRVFTGTFPFSTASYAFDIEVAAYEKKLMEYGVPFLKGYFSGSADGKADPSTFSYQGATFFFDKGEGDYDEVDFILLTVPYAGTLPPGCFPHLQEKLTTAQVFIAATTEKSRHKDIEDVMVEDLDQWSQVKRKKEAILIK